MHDFTYTHNNHWKDWEGRTRQSAQLLTYSDIFSSQMFWDMSENWNIFYHDSYLPDGTRQWKPRLLTGCLNSQLFSQNWHKFDISRLSTPSIASLLPHKVLHGWKPATHPQTRMHICSVCPQNPYLCTSNFKIMYTKKGQKRKYLNHSTVALFVDSLEN